MAKLNSKELETAKGFLLDLFWAGGIIQNGDSSLGTQLTKRSSTIKDYHSSEAKVICDEIKFRAFDFFKVDGALDIISQRKFFADPSKLGWRRDGIRAIRRSKETLATYIANFCKTNQIYWDDVHTNKTTYEMDQYKQSVIGGALWEFSCFLSQNLNNDSQTPAGQQTVRTRKATTRVAGQPPVNNYKASGPQSGNVRALHGTPGQKVFASASGNVIFYIEGDNAKATASPARALVKPLTKGADVNGTNKVFISSGHGYTDCVCYFDDLANANKFLNKCLTVCPSHISNLKVAKRPADRNGYFLVGTEFGEVAITAKSMNEKVGVNYDVQDPEIYEEAMFKYE